MILYCTVVGIICSSKIDIYFLNKAASPRALTLLNLNCTIELISLGILVSLDVAMGTNDTTGNMS